MIDEDKITEKKVAEYEAAAKKKFVDEPYNMKIV